MDLSRSIVIGNTFSGPIKRTTAKWLLDHFPPGHFLCYVKEVPMIVGRNAMIRDGGLATINRFQKDQGIEVDWVFFVDNDVTITKPGIDNFLAVPGDVVSCECRMQSAHAWGEKDAFHDHFWRCRAEVLRAIEPPWFTENWTEDGCNVVGCECLTFRAKAIEAGFRVRHGGWCGHENAHSWTGRRVLTPVTGDAPTQSAPATGGV